MLSEADRDMLEQQLHRQVNDTCEFIGQRDADLRLALAEYEARSAAVRVDRARAKRERRNARNQRNGDNDRHKVIRRQYVQQSRQYYDSVGMDADMGSR